MKKDIIIVIIFIIGYMLLQSNSVSGIQIPDEAIRLRVIPNSNSIYDQEMKMKVKSELESTTSLLLRDASNIMEARNIVKNNLNIIENNIRSVLEEANYPLVYKIDFGMNYFPEKDFKGITYEEGKYESLVVTLGNGIGENWWCVLFPPLCLLEAEETDTDEVEYKFFVKELIDKYF